MATATGIVEAVANAMRANNLDVRIVDTGEEARRLILEMVPHGAEVHAAKSKTLRDIGVTHELESGRYDYLRPRYMAMDRKTQGREIRKLVAAPDYMLGSVQAVTESGDLVVVSASSSQLGPYAMGAGKLILVVGSQKIVPDLDAAFRRIDEVVTPYEDASLREQLGVGTFIGKILLIRREGLPGRTTVILVREPVGV